MAQKLPYLRFARLGARPARSDDRQVVAQVVPQASIHFLGTAHRRGDSATDLRYERSPMGLLRGVVEPVRSRCVLAIALVLFLAGPARSDEALVAAFDWSMPDRLGLDEEPADGVIDVLSSPAEIDPGGWNVAFDACASSHVSEYRWTIDGEAVAQSSSCSGFVGHFPREGAYRVGLEVGTGERTASVEHDVVVQDWLIVALGDSYGSGEGNPDLPIGEDAFDAWEDAADALAEAAADAAAAAVALADARDLLDRFVVLATDVRDEREALRAAERARDRACSSFPFLGCPAAELAVNQARLDLLEALAEPLLDLNPAALIDNLDLIEAELLKSQSLLLAGLELAQSAFEAEDALRRVAEDGVDEALRALEGTWQDRRCHRSAKSGQALAALEIERADPRTSVTLVHLACSGARITSGLLLPDRGAEGPGPGEPESLPPQVSEAQRLIGNREVDAVILTIGGNDAGFSDVLQACIATEPCHRRPTSIDPTIGDTTNVVCAGGLLDAFTGPCTSYLTDLVVDPEDANAAEIFSSALDGRPPSSCAAEDQLSCASLSGRYDALQESFASWDGLSAERVYLTEYPSVTTDDDGSFCEFEPRSPLRMLPGWSAEESMWAEAVFLSQLNATMFDAASRHGWRYVDGIAADFVTHGYCSSENWIVRLTESLLMQGADEPFAPDAPARINGTAHPNGAGQRAYAARIAAALRSDLYTGGELTRPRHPRAIDPCPGDCNGDGQVSISELIRGVNIALGLAEAPACPILDGDGDDRVSIAELVRAVNRALSGC